MDGLQLVCTFEREKLPKGAELVVPLAGLLLQASLSPLTQPLCVGAARSWAWFHQQREAALRLAGFVEAGQGSAGTAGLR